MEKEMKIIDEVLAEVGLKAAQFAKSIEVHPTQIYDLQSGKTKSISPAMAAKIVETYPQFSKYWLMTGEGEMLKTSKLRNEVEDVSADELKKIDEGLKKGQFRMVPLINIDSVGGLHSENALVPSEQYIIKMMPFSEAKEGDVAILQSGNSMYPTIPSGSALLIREVHDWRKYFGYGNIYVIVLKDGRRITKEVRRYDENPKDYVWCVSYNPDVADEELPKSMISSVWKVVKYIADFGW